MDSNTVFNMERPSLAAVNVSVNTSIWVDFWSIVGVKSGMYPSTPDDLDGSADV